MGELERSGRQISYRFFYIAPLESSKDFIIFRPYFCRSSFGKKCHCVKSLACLPAYSVFCTTTAAVNININNCCVFVPHHEYVPVVDREAAICCFLFNSAESLVCSSFILARRTGVSLPLSFPAAAAVFCGTIITVQQQ